MLVSPSRDNIVSCTHFINYCSSRGVDESRTQSSRRFVVDWVRMHTPSIPDFVPVYRDTFTDSPHRIV